MAKTTKPSYADLRQELDEIMQELSREDLDVDQAVKYYERGVELIEQLQNYLSTAQNRVRELKSASKK